MFDVNEILAMLQNGENPDDIAQKALDAVNEAQRIQKEEEKQARIEAEKKLAAKKQEARYNALDSVFIALIDYLDLFDVQTANQVASLWENMTDEEINELHNSVEALCQMTVALQKLDSTLGNDIGLVSRLNVDPKSITIQAPKKTKSDDEVIAKFLSKILD